MSIRFLYTIVFVMILNVGCSHSVGNEIEETTKIKAEQVQIYEDAFLAEHIEADLDGDGEKESIKMYIKPEPVEDKEHKGQYLWDDSHLWQLIVFDGDKTYPLFNNHLSGKLKFWIENNGGEKTIILLIDAREVSLETYRYHAEGYYFRTVHYKSRGEDPLIRSTTIK